MALPIMSAGASASNRFGGTDEKGQCPQGCSAHTAHTFSDGAIARCLADGGMDKTLLSAATKQALRNRSASDDHYYKIFRITKALQQRFADLPSSVYVNILHVAAHLFTHAIEVRVSSGVMLCADEGLNTRLASLCSLRHVAHRYATKSRLLPTLAVQGSLSGMDDAGDGAAATALAEQQKGIVRDLYHLAARPSGNEPDVQAAAEQHYGKVVLPCIRTPLLFAASIFQRHDVRLRRTVSALQDSGIAGAASSTGGAVELWDFHKAAAAAFGVDIAKLEVELADVLEEPYVQSLRGDAQLTSPGWQSWIGESTHLPCALRPPLPVHVAALHSGNEPCIACNTLCRAVTAVSSPLLQSG